MTTETKIKTLTNASEIRSLFTYNPENGDIHSRRTGKKLGSKNRRGYVVVYLKGVYVGAHRIAWMYMYGDISKKEIDHKDGDRSNNSIKNLRLADRFENMANTKPRNKPSGLPEGVFRVKNSKTFYTYLSNGKKKIYLGTFQKAEDAGEFYKLACEMVRGDFAAHMSR